jgi:nitrogen regulatory protein PII
MREKAIITIVVQRKDGSSIIDAAAASGVQGATYFYARGTGVRQRLGLLGRLIDAEKHVVLLAVPADKAEEILHNIISATGLSKPGEIFAFIQPASFVYGALDN